MLIFNLDLTWKLPYGCYQSQVYEGIKSFFINIISVRISTFCPGLGIRASATFKHQWNRNILTFKFSWMFKTVPKQTIHLFRFFFAHMRIQISGLYEAVTQLPSPASVCISIHLTIWSQAKQATLNLISESFAVPYPFLGITFIFLGREVGDYNYIQSKSSFPKKIIIICLPKYSINLIPLSQSKID